MFTPRDISKVDFQPDDYSWSGALFATHSLYSYNLSKKYDLQTELVLGILGPAALAAQTQKAVHRMIGYQQPMGWGHQFRNDLLLNINISAEKQWTSSDPGTGLSMEMIGGGELSAGTMLNEAGIYTIVRIGNISLYCLLK